MSLTEEMGRLGYTPFYTAPTTQPWTLPGYWINAEGQRVTIADLAREVARLRDGIAGLRLPHVECADTYFSCPQEAGDGPVLHGPSAGDDCQCGATEHNARIDALLAGTHEEINP